MVEIASGKKAANILMLDMREVTLLADYYVLCNGSSSRQIRAIGDELLEKLKHAGSRLASVEGTPESGWMLSRQIVTVTVPVDWQLPAATV